MRRLICHSLLLAAVSILAGGCALPSDRAAADASRELSGTLIRLSETVDREAADYLEKFEQIKRRELDLAKASVLAQIQKERELTAETVEVVETEFRQRHADLSAELVKAKTAYERRAQILLKAATLATRLETYRQERTINPWKAFGTGATKGILDTKSELLRLLSLLETP